MTLVLIGPSRSSGAPMFHVINRLFGTNMNSVCFMCHHFVPPSPPYLMESVLFPPLSDGPSSSSQPKYKSAMEANGLYNLLQIFVWLFVSSEPFITLFLFHSRDHRLIFFPHLVTVQIFAASTSATSPRCTPSQPATPQSFYSTPWSSLDSTPHWLTFK